MQSADLISVVVTTYNRSDALLAVLRGLARQSDACFEIVIADDGSSATHRQTLLDAPVSRALRLTHVWHPDIGFTASRARNRGVAASRGSYLIFLDGDCVPDRDFVSQHRKLAAPACFLNGSRVLLSPALTARVLCADEDVTGRGALYWLARRLRGDASKLGQVLRFPDPLRRRQATFRWKGIRSCNLGVWRSDFERIDGFDESFVGWGHEDADLVLRLHNAGVARKDGFFGTEVYHLWHQEASRQSASANAQVVREREAGKLIRASRGLSQVRPNDDGVVTRLG